MMAGGPLERRIEKLEARPASAANVRAGMRLLAETGQLPRAARVGGLVQDLAAAVEAMRATVPAEPPPGYVPPERPAVAASGPLLAVEARPVPMCCVDCGEQVTRGVPRCPTCGAQPDTGEQVRAV